MPFFWGGELSCVTSIFFLFFSFPFTPFFFSFFLLELRCFSSLFGVGHFSFFILRGAEFVLLVFGLFSLFLIFFCFRCCAFLLFLSGGGCRIRSSCFWSLFLVSYFLLLFSVLDFSPFSFWGVPNLFFLLLVSFPCFLFSGGLVFSLSLLRSPEQAAPK